MKLRIEIDLSGIIEAGGVLTGAVLPVVRQGIGTIAAVVEQDWKESVLLASGKGGIRAEERNAYADSIHWEYTGDFSAVVRAGYKHAAEIENGRPQYDLKQMLGTSSKTRVTAKGKRYLIIPFRHNTPGNDAHAPAMPSSVHALASQLRPSSVIGKRLRVNADGNPTPSRKYLWGDRLPAGTAPKLSTRHTTDRYAGMVRFNTSTPGAKSSSFLTFRVMMEGSDKWIIPERPGLYLLKGVVDRSAPLPSKIIGEVMAAML